MSSSQYASLKKAMSENKIMSEIAKYAFYMRICKCKSF